MSTAGNVSPLVGIPFKPCYHCSYQLVITRTKVKEMPLVPLSSVTPFRKCTEKLRMAPSISGAYSMSSSDFQLQIPQTNPEGEAIIVYCLDRNIDLTYKLLILKSLLTIQWPLSWGFRGRLDLVLFNTLVTAWKSAHIASFWGGVMDSHVNPENLWPDFLQQMACEIPPFLTMWQHSGIKKHQMVPVPPSSKWIHTDNYTESWHQILKANYLPPPECQCMDKVVQLGFQKQSAACHTPESLRLICYAIHEMRYHLRPHDFSICLSLKMKYVHKKFSIESFTNPQMATWTVTCQEGKQGDNSQLTFCIFPHFRITGSSYNEGTHLRTREQLDEISTMATCACWRCNAKVSDPIETVDRLENQANFPIVSFPNPFIGQVELVTNCLGPVGAPTQKQMTGLAQLLGIGVDVMTMLPHPPKCWPDSINKANQFRICLNWSSKIFLPVMPVILLFPISLISFISSSLSYLTHFLILLVLFLSPLLFLSLLKSSIFTDQHARHSRALGISRKLDVHGTWNKKFLPNFFHFMNNQPREIVEISLTVTRKRKAYHHGGAHITWWWRCCLIWVFCCLRDSSGNVGCIDDCA
ncbi:hypothetical protein VP01_3164g1 [Puccinia sorghi]|uniref:Uncharacterized protein n=1 Tax=Puccinia sorghi TaxID=27349 RepID=A0A0L6UZK7_9BASI|nr:hypothetical protein VP01_3164g1 [Puccinia sorghi]